MSDQQLADNEWKIYTHFEELKAIVIVVFTPVECIAVFGRNRWHPRAEIWVVAGMSAIVSVAGCKRFLSKEGSSEASVCLIRL